MCNNCLYKIRLYRKYTQAQRNYNQIAFRDKSLEVVVKKVGIKEEKMIIEMSNQKKRRTGTGENTERVKENKIERSEQTAVEIISSYKTL